MGLGRLTRLSRRYATSLEQLEQLILLTDQPAALASTNRIVSDWSVSQHVEHLARAATAVNDRIDEALDLLPSRQHCCKPNLRGRLVLVLGRIPRRKAKAPEMTIPTGMDSAVLKQHLQKEQARLKALAARLADMAECPCSTKHPALGSLTPTQWIKFLEIHQRHHMAIISKIGSLQRSESAPSE